jgi:(p)ppGpp synthase/HD superfamily hydrolase
MLVLKAISYAAKMHKGQVRRESGLPYVVHPMAVMELIQMYKGDSTNIDSLKCAALLHDVLEDTDSTYIEIEREFTPMVASIVMELTSDEEAINEIGKNNYLKNKMINMSNYAFLLKLVDRLSNVIDSPRPKYVKDTITLMTHIMAARVNITSTQMNVIKAILQECKGNYNEMD